MFECCVLTVGRQKCQGQMDTPVLQPGVGGQQVCGEGKRALVCSEHKPLLKLRGTIGQQTAEVSFSSTDSPTQPKTSNVNPKQTLQGNIRAGWICLLSRADFGGMCGGEVLPARRV